MWVRGWAVLASLWFAASSARAQDQGAYSQSAVDEAIRRGVETLKTAPSTSAQLLSNCDELILLTLIHAGVSEKDEVYKKYLDATLAARLEFTYKVSLHAMCLEELDPAKYQHRIAQCGQFLIDNQTTKGQWSYGLPTASVLNVPVPTPRKAVASGGRSRKPGAVDPRSGRVKSEPAGWVVLSQSRTSPEEPDGDNSNSQYAALGLRACHDAKVKIPEAVTRLARDWWVKSQREPADGADKNAVSTGGERPRGWDYARPLREPNGTPRHTMTAGAVASMCILDSMLGIDCKNDPVVRSGAAWLAAKFTVTNSDAAMENSAGRYYYYMYGLERAGILYGVESFGSHNWYFEGAKALVALQNADGSWGRREKERNTWDTCWAILFLKRATRPMVASTDLFKKK